MAAFPVRPHAAHPCRAFPAHPTHDRPVRGGGAGGVVQRGARPPAAVSRRGPAPGGAAAGVCADLLRRRPAGPHLLRHVPVGPQAAGGSCSGGWGRGRWVVCEPGSAAVGSVGCHLLRVCPCNSELHASEGRHYGLGSGHFLPSMLVAASSRKAAARHVHRAAAGRRQLVAPATSTPSPQNIPFVLYHHLNHEENRPLLPHLLPRLAGPGGAAAPAQRLLRVLCAACFRPEWYSGRSRISSAVGAFSTVYRASLPAWAGEGCVVLKLVETPKFIQDRCAQVCAEEYVSCCRGGGVAGACGSRRLCVSCALPAAILPNNVLFALCSSAGGRAGRGGHSGGAVRLPLCLPAGASGRRLWQEGRAVDTHLQLTTLSGN